MPTRGPRPEGQLERLARHIVAQELSVVVDRNDDGTADRQPDGMILYPTYSAPLEVVSDEDPLYASQAYQLAKRGRSIPALDHRGW